MKVQFRGKTHWITFRYEKPSTYTKHGKLQNHNGITHCIIETEGFYPVASGASICIKGDRFNKETGRKLSLARALESLDKEDRTIFWDAYHNRKLNNDKTTTESIS